MRQRIAAGLLVLVGLISINQMIDLKGLKINTLNGSLQVIDRVNCLRGALPEGVQRFGYLPALDLIVTQKMLNNQEPYMSMGEQFHRFYLARYAVTPRLITQAPDQPWIIASFPDHETGLRKIQQGDWKIIKDCENGVFLLHQ